MVQSLAHVHSNIHLNSFLKQSQRDAAATGQAAMAAHQCSQAQSMAIAGPNMMQGGGPSKFEISQVAETDPSLMGGYKLAYERQVPMQLLVVNKEMIAKVGHHVQVDEKMLVKVLYRGSEETPETVRIELLSKKDYFFMYEHVCDVFLYDEMKEAQELHPTYAEYLTILIKLFNQAVETPETYKCQVQLNIDNSADLFFMQALTYKRLQLLGCHFEQSDDDKVQRHIKYRHMTTHISYLKAKAQLAHVCATIKEKNPSLIEHICREVQLKRPYGFSLDPKKLAAAKKRSSQAGSKSRGSRTSARSRTSKRSSMAFSSK